MTAIDKLTAKIDQLWADSAIGGILAKIEDIGEPVDEAELKLQLGNVFTVAHEALEDGFQIMDIVPILSAALQDIMVVGEGLHGANGEDKLNFVVATFTNLYTFIDKGIDGTKNRMDIPWVPQVVEDYVESKVLPIAIRFAVEAVIKAWNKSRDSN